MTQGDVDNANKQWEITHHKAPASGCFPGNATVQRQEGATSRLVSISELALGDRLTVVGANGNRTTSEVLFWSHRMPKTRHSYIQLHGDDGALLLETTPTHLVHIDRYGHLLPMREVKAGHHLLSKEGFSRRVGYVRHVKHDSGVYNFVFADVDVESVYVNGHLASILTQQDARVTMGEVMRYLMRSAQRLPIPRAVWGIECEEGRSCVIATAIALRNMFM